MPPLPRSQLYNSSNDDRYDYSRHRSLMHINDCAVYAYDQWLDELLKLMRSHWG